MITDPKWKQVLRELWTVKGCYWTIPATSTQGTTKRRQDYIVRASLSANMDLELHKSVFWNLLLNVNSKLFGNLNRDTNLIKINSFTVLLKSATINYYNLYTFTMTITNQTITKGFIIAGLMTALYWFFHAFLPMKLFEFDTSYVKIWINMI
jgi:hypothetical protein